MTPGGQGPTLEDVASLAGVSRATASRVIRGDVKVRQAKTEAVQKAVERLGYVPNPMARGLVTRSAGAIALVIPEPQSRLFTDPFFGSAVAAISERLAETDLQLILMVSAADGRRDRLWSFLRGGHADGLLVMSQRQHDETLKVLEDTPLPTVFIGRPPVGSDAPFVDVDNVIGGRRAVEHLLAKGRSRIAMIGGPSDMAAAEDRRSGFEAALADAGLEPAAQVEGDFTLSSGEEGIERLLARGVPFDAVFAANDLMAIGALRRLYAADLRVPEDVAIVGFDDTDLAAEPINALTTVANPVHDLGTIATSMLIDALNGEPTVSQVLDKAVVRERRTA